MVARRNGWLILIWSLLTVGIYTIAWLTLLQREHPRRATIDPPAWLWFCTWLGFGVLMFIALGASGFAKWQHWPAADVGQRWLFAAALFVAVLFNVWFGYGCLRLTDRFAALMGNRLTPARGKLTRVTIIAATAIAMVVMILPLLAQVQVLALPDSVLSALQLMAHFGTGSLLAWSVSIHLQANSLVRLAERTFTADTKPLPSCKLAG